MNEWDVGPKYKFTIYYNELDVVNVEQENRQLKEKVGECFGRRVK